MLLVPVLNIKLTPTLILLKTNIFMNSKLTEHQQLQAAKSCGLGCLYDFIWDKRNWRPPTWKAMAVHMAVKSNQSIAEILKAIEVKGYKLPDAKS